MSSAMGSGNQSSSVSPESLQIQPQQRWDHYSIEGKVPGMSLLWPPTAKGLKSLPVLLETAAGTCLPRPCKGRGKRPKWMGNHAADCSLSVPPQLHPLHSIHKHKALEECFHRLKLQLFLKFWQQHASEIFPALLKSGFRRQKHEGGVWWVSCCKPDQEMQENLSRIQRY